MQIWARQSARLGWDVLAGCPEMLHAKSEKGTGFVAKRSVTKAGLRMLVPC